MNTEYRAFVVSEQNGDFIGKVENKKISDLPLGDVLIEVKYSSVNFKDALSANGNKGVSRNYPHTPGIDASGIVVESLSPRFKVGDEVLVTGYDLGMNTSGGFQQFIRVPSAWVVPLPKGLSLRESMIIGTAGFTAALSVYKMIKAGIRKEDGEVLVTGATGGVGSMAVAILSKLGYSVVALTGKVSEAAFLRALGASEIIDRHEFIDSSPRPLLKSRFSGVIDTVGGEILSTAIKLTKYNGVVTCCGMVHANSFTSSVFPFILRGVSLIGIDSVECPMDLRRTIWHLLAREYKVTTLEHLVYEITLDDLNETFSTLIQGKGRGRTLVVL